MEKILASALAAFAILSLSACSNADYSNADDTLPKVSDAKPKVVVLDGFKKENIAYLDRKSAKLPPDGKTLSIDTTQTGGKFFANMLKFKTGMLKPNTAYVFNMTAKVEADSDAYLHMLVRNTANFRNGTDALRFNVVANGRPEKFSAKFKTGENGGDYALMFTAFSKLSAVVENVSIIEDDSFRAIPIEGNKTDYVLDRSALPTGAKEFDIDLPNNPNGAIVRAKDFGITPEKTVHPKDINKALEHCKKIGAAKLIFEKDAVYNVVGDSSILIADMKDFTFDANGSTFVFLKKKASNFWIKDNTRIKICNLKIDWDWSKDPLASLVKITEVNDAEGYVEFKFVHYDTFPHAPDYVRCATLSAWDETEKSVGLEGVMPFNYDMFPGRKPRPKFKWTTPNTLRLYGNTNHPSAKFVELLYRYAKLAGNVYRTPLLLGIFRHARKHLGKFIALLLLGRPLVRQELALYKLGERVGESLENNHGAVFAVDLVQVDVHHGVDVVEARKRLDYDFAAENPVPIGIVFEVHPEQIRLRHFDVRVAQAVRRNYQGLALAEFVFFAVVLYRKHPAHDAQNVGEFLVSARVVITLCVFGESARNYPALCENVCRQIFGNGDCVRTAVD